MLPRWGACIAGCICSIIRIVWSSSDISSTCARIFRVCCVEESGDCAIVVEGANAEIPTVSAIPLGFIVNELITNSAKYAKGNIIVRFETTSSGRHSLSVLDGGPGLPAGFDPTAARDSE